MHLGRLASDLVVFQGKIIDSIKNSVKNRPVRLIAPEKNKLGSGPSYFENLPLGTSVASEKSS